MTDLAKANKEYFDKLASEANLPREWQEVSDMISRELRKRLDWIGVNWASPSSPDSDHEVRFLDYACGSGSMTRAFAPYITTAIGIDISPNMIKLFSQLAEASGLPSSHITAVVGDLLSTPPTENVCTREFHDFDLAAIGLGFHHFGDQAAALQRLAERLRPGGVVLIVDLRGDHPMHGKGHPAMKTIHRGGFEEEEVKRLFEGVGLVEFGFQTLPEKMRMKKGDSTFEREVFVAKGRKPG
ncbi:hypothetical protein LTS18_002508 [Coniosporium uncinatum]|uniref:Uncharacterized protein n=1 Tax=Coniosporium uncinatum TaxID=93489 RepID=A0ACC3DU95_9PEZI|nr:hypothetical protein LTS18_002508 [Coniosporium uncinatum]